MKTLSLLLITLITLSCTQNDLITGEDVKINFQATPIGETSGNTSFSHMRIIVLNDNQTIFRTFSFNETQLKQNNLSAHLPIGKYNIIFIANGPQENEVSCNIGDTQDKILLKLLKKGSHYQEASDFLTATHNITIAEGKNNSPIAVNLERRVGKLQIQLNEIRPDIDSIKIELGGAPISSSTDGTKLGSSGKILKKMNHTKGNSSGSIELLTFPIAQGKVDIGILYTKNQITYRGVMKLAPAIERNRIVQANGKFIPTGEQTFNFIIQSWDGTIIESGNFEFSDSDDIVADDRPATGEPTGNNLLQNNGFEEWMTNNHPKNWILSKDGSHNVITKNTNNTFISQGTSSLRMEHQTYIYQDIPVEAHQCYQIKLKVNSTATSYKWKVACSWRETTSSALPADTYKAIQTNESKNTNGWYEVFPNENNKFRAPAGAKILRIEIRTYKPDGTPGPEEGVYLDDFEVYLLK